MHFFRCYSMRRLLLVIILGAIGAYFVLNVVLRIHEQSMASSYGDTLMERLTQIELMERSINSPLNRAICVIPRLPIDNPSILAFDKKAPKIDCGNSLDDWVTCEKHICFVKPEIYREKGQVFCTFWDILRVTDKRNILGQAVPHRDTYILRESDFVKVACTGSNGSGWTGTVAGVRSGLLSSVRKYNQASPLSPFPVYPWFKDTKDPVKGLLRPFNILIYGFDSLSHNAFMRKLPRTYRYLVEEIEAKVLNGYNIVGDGTAQALIPLLTGHTELELPETRWRQYSAHWVDEVYPLIWQDYQRNGYITSFNEDLPEVGTFTYRLKGFRHQPVHHYLRTIYVENSLSRKNVPHCIDHQPDHQIMLNYTRNIINSYKELVPYFLFSFHGGLSHDDYNLISVADDDILNWLKDLHTRDALNHTILIFMSDHGNRFAEVRKTLQGKQEERLPFFSFAFPKSFRKRFPQEYANFLENRDRLTTPFDVHATLKHILKLQKNSRKRISSQMSLDSFLGENEISQQYEEEEKEKEEDVREENNATPWAKMSPLAQNRAISLLNPIPVERSCADAYIEMHWCACLNWQTVNLTESIGLGERRPNVLLLKAATSIVTTINNATQPFRRYCELLHLDQINWALHLSMNNDMLHFEKTIDKDGFVPQIMITENSDSDALLDDNDANRGGSTTGSVLYQLQVTLLPGNSVFEASVSHDRRTDTFETKLSQISRINRYGEQARCIYNRNPELRKYCYCRQQVV